MSDFDDYMTPSEERATAIIKRQAAEIDKLRAALRVAMNHITDYDALAVIEAALGEKA